MAPQPTTPSKAAVASSGWATLPSRIKAEDAATAARADAALLHRRQQKADGVSKLETEVPASVLHDTWRQVTVKSDGTRGRLSAGLLAVHAATPATVAGPLVAGAPSGPRLPSAGGAPITPLLAQHEETAGHQPEMEFLHEFEIMLGEVLTASIEAKKRAEMQLAENNELQLSLAEKLQQPAKSVEIEETEDAMVMRILNSGWENDLEVVEGGKKPYSVDEKEKTLIVDDILNAPWE